MPFLFVSRGTRRIAHVANRSRLAMLRFVFVSAALLFGFAALAPLAHAQTFGCSPAMSNDIVCENSKTGNPSSQWDISGSGDSTIQGFATDISVNQGGTIQFKIKTDARSYTIEIYRMGYYQGNGARLIATISPSATLPQLQPACLTNTSVGLYDCGNWAVSASWAVPSNAVSGIYFARLIRGDTGGASHIFFIVRNDSSHSDLLYQTADETWVAYNGYGGGSFYGPDNQFNLNNRSFKISYNRPSDTRSFESATWLFSAEYPMVRWIEANGYDVTYFTHVDGVRSPADYANHKVLVSAGHDEYWSGPLRANVEAARDAGMHMAFFSGNEVFWKTRWENSTDGSNTPYRTLVCYKETLAGSKTDPASAWTGTWRDPRFSPPSDGGKPENALTGTIFGVNGPGGDNIGLAIKVPAADGKMRFWRNTAYAAQAAGSTATLPAGTLGYEWDVDIDNGFRPAGLFPLSTATYSLTTDLLLDYGGTYGSGSATHHLTLYRAPSGALVFGAGTVQWTWGLDQNHDADFSPASAPDVNMQQATVNLFGDMGIQPATLQAGLTPASKSTDTTPPVSAVTSPSSGATVTAGSPITISGTASDFGGGNVAAVEVSTDGGTTWHPAVGRGPWTYSWTPLQLGSATINSRAVDDSGNLSVAAAGISVTVAAHDCPCDAWGTSATPSLIDSGDGGSIEVGVKFRSDYNGYITGIRFYKGSTNTGTHVGNLWSSAGALLARATFTNETASGWQQVNFANPVAITANTTYVASYFAPVGHYSADTAFFATTGLDNPPIHLLKNGVDGPNGVYIYSPSSAFPTATFSSTNYWVDVVFLPSGSMPGAPPALVALPSSLAFTGSIGQGNPADQTIQIYNQGSAVLNYISSSNASWLSLSPASGTTPATANVKVNATGLAAGTYNGAITISASGAANSPQTVNVTLTVTNILMSSNFSSGNTEGWAVSPLGHVSNWSVANQVLTSNPAAPSQLYAGNSAWTNYTLSASVKFTNASNYPGGLRGRVNPATGAGYVVWLYPATGQAILYKNTTWSIDAGTLTQLGAGSASFDTVNFHNVQLSFSGSQIQVLYDNKVVITATDATYANGLVALDSYNQPLSFANISVTSNTANTGSYTLTPSSLTFSSNYQGPSPAPQTVQLASGSGTLAFTAVSTASWLTAGPADGSSPAALQVAASTGALAAGAYNGTVRVTSFGAATPTQSINVSLTVVAPPPALVVSPGGLNFVANQGQAPPPAQSLAITNAGSGSFTWTASSDSAWLVASPGSGSSPASLGISVSITGLATGSYTGHITVTASGIANSPQVIPVTLQVYSPDLTENFSNLANGWIISPMGNAGGWSVSNGVYSYNGSGLSQSCAGNAGWTDYTFTTTIKLSNLSNWPGGVRARVNPSTGAGYVVWLYPTSGLAILYKVGQWDINGAVLTQLAQATVGFNIANHDLAVKFAGSAITVSWDGAQMMSATDASYASGYVCMDADNQPISYSNVRVSAVQAQAAIDTPSPSSLTFSALPGAPPAAQTVNISAGGAATTFATTSSAPWLTAKANSTLTPGVLTVNANPSGLPEGTYNGTLTIYAPGASNSPSTVPVTLAVKTAVLGVTPTSLNFFGATSQNPPAQSIQINNLGTGVLGWSATPSSNWLGLSSTSGTAPSTLTVSPNTASLASGSYTDTITISSPDVNNSPATVNVSTQVGALLFYDDFSAGAGNWTVGPLGHAAGWSVVSGAYTFDGSGHTQSWAGSSGWTNYTVSADVKLASLNNYPGGLRGRVNPSTGASYGAWIYPAQGLIRLFRIGQWNIDVDNTLLGTSGALAMNTSAHNLRLTFQGATIKVYYDNVLVITATDASYAQGAVALDVSNQPITFDNVTVISLL